MKFKFKPFPRLVTERLTLRLTTLNDREEVFFLRSDKEVNKYVKRPTPADVGKAEKFMNKIADRSREWREY
ncbi:MAG: GNAT family N-acetyltransferase [Bacteroidetes bacterium]|nr:GNAT family N-acetyltransferase [Bacteroidota bacterium]